MLFENYIRNFTEPRQVCLTPIDASGDGELMYFTLTNAHKVSSSPTRTTFRLKLEADRKRFTGILNEISFTSLRRPVVVDEDDSSRAYLLDLDVCA